MRPFTTCLWFDTEGEEAARFYVDVFPDSRIEASTPYVDGERAGQVMTVEMTLNGANFLALNGGPQYRFTEAVSFQVLCADQAEVDHYWDRLCEGGEPGPCGWLKDRFGVSWQVVPTRLLELLGDPTVASAVAQAMYPMGKLVIADLEAAARH